MCATKVKQVIKKPKKCKMGEKKYYSAKEVAGCYGQTWQKFRQRFDMLGMPDNPQNPTDWLVDEVNMEVIRAKYEVSLNQRSPEKYRDGVKLVKRLNPLLVNLTNSLTSTNQQSVNVSVNTNEGEVKRLRDKVELLVKKLNEKDEEVKRLNESTEPPENPDVAAMEQKIEELERKVKEMDTDNFILFTNGSKKDNEIKELKAERDELNKRLAELASPWKIEQVLENSGRFITILLSSLPLIYVYYLSVIGAESFMQAELMVRTIGVKLTPAWVIMCGLLLSALFIGLSEKYGSAVLAKYRAWDGRNWVDKNLTVSYATDVFFLIYNLLLCEFRMFMDFDGGFWEGTVLAVCGVVIPLVIFGIGLTLKERVKVKPTVGLTEVNQGSVSIG